MDSVEEVVIVGAGLSGLATALGLHRKGVRSVVLESSEFLRAAGFAFTTWTNAWKALDTLGVADSLRQQHLQLEGLVIHSSSSGTNISRVPIKTEGKSEGPEIRCVRRNLLLQTLANELPHGTIRFSSKLVSIEESGNLKLLHLADGSTLKTKVLIGCDGVNSEVAKWLGLRKPSFSGRSATRGFAEYPDGHGFNPDFLQFFGEGFRAGAMPCDDKSLYWFFTWTSSSKDKEMDGDATKMRKFVISKLKQAKMPEEFIETIEKSDMTGVVSTPLRYRWPFDLIWGNVSKGNVCVAGDAFHAMTPDLGQGGCSALEDGVVLARCLSKALNEGFEKEEEERRIQMALEKYAKERRWRAFDLVTTALVLGIVQQSDNGLLGFLREKFSGVMAKALVKRSQFDCGKL